MEKLNSRKDVLFGLLAIAVVLLTALGMINAINRQAQMEAERKSCEDAIHLFLSGSDVLTSEVFAYADTNDAQHMNNYWQEADVTKSRSEAVRQLERYPLSDEERSALISAVNASNELMTLETHAMRLIAECSGLEESEMPTAVAEYRLRASEEGLLPQEKDGRANELLFGRSYMTQKNDIIRSVEAFSYHLNARFGEASILNTRRALAFISVCVVSFIVFIFLFIMETQKNDARRQEELRQREECFRIVANQTGRFVFRYDIPTRTYYRMTGYGGANESQLSVIPDIVEKAIAHGVVCKDSAAACREFFDEIDSGNTPKDTDIKLVERDGGSGWYRFSATLVSLSFGSASTAVVSYADCDQQREREMAYSRWQQEMENLPSKNTVLLEWNITQNIFEGERGDARVSPSAYAHATFDEVAQIYANGNVIADDRQAYLSVVNRAHLLGMYHSGRTGAELEYRETRGEEAYHWMRLTVRLVLYPNSSDVKAYIAAMDVDEEKRAELTLIAKSELDPLTGAYNRGAFIEKVKALLSGDPSRTHVLMMLDIDEFKSVNDTYGHDFGDKVLLGFTNAVRHALRPDDIVGRIGGDEFMICIPNVPSESVMLKKAEQLIHAIPAEISDERRVSVSMGVALFPRDGASFEELYKKADIALYRVKTAGKGNFCVYAAGMEEGGNIITSFDK